MRVAVIMPGLLGCYQVSIDSIMENLIIPNKADVFILTSKYNYVHASSENFNPCNFEFPVDQTDEDLIVSCFGNHIKYFAYSEDLPGYQEEMQRQQEGLKKRLVGLENLEREFYYDQKTKTIMRPTWYLDQFLKMKFLIREITDYDVVMRYRIDQILTKLFVVPEVKGNILWWSGMDNLFYANQDVMKQVCHNFIDGIGAYVPPSFLRGVKGQNYGLSSDGQFSGFLRQSDYEVNRTRSNFGWRLHRRDSVCNIFDYGISESKRVKSSLSPKDYYVFESCKVPYHSIFDTENPILWAYFLH